MQNKKQITPAQRRQYNDTRRNLRARRKKEKEWEKTTGQRLAKRMLFLRVVYTSLGYSLREFCDAAGIYPQLRYYYFSTQDDCQLSKAMEWCEKIGVVLSYDLVPKREDDFLDGQIVINENNNPVFSVNGILQRELKRKPELGDIYHVFEQAMAEEKRLSVLARRLGETGLSNEIAKILGWHSSKLWQIFERDDISISDLYDIAEKFNFKVAWKVKANNPR